MATVNLGKVCIVHKGDYDSTTSYEKLDVVRYNGATYISIDYVTGENPSESSKWKLLAADGVFSANAGNGITIEGMTINVSEDLLKNISGKADKATTLADYGITDGEKIANKITDKSKITDEDANYPSIGYLNDYYYDFSEIDKALSGKLDNTLGSVTTDNIANKAVTSDKVANGAITALKLAKGAVSGSNIADNQIGTNHLQSSAVTSDKLANDVIEKGSGSLTPYSSSADIVKSADFTYQRVGRVVTVNVNIVFNAGTKSQVMFTNLPYVCKNTVNPRELCVSNSKVTRIWAINKNNTTLSIFSDSSLSYADEETLAFTLSYLVS